MYESRNSHNDLLHIKIKRDNHPTRPLLHNRILSLAPAVGAGVGHASAVPAVDARGVEGVPARCKRLFVGDDVLETDAAARHRMGLGVAIAELNLYSTGEDDPHFLKYT